MGASTPASAESPGEPPPHAMRLLVTNPWNGQAYCVLRSLRRHATRVVATVYREHGALGRLAPAAVSRFVDRVYPVPLRTYLPGAPEDAPELAKRLGYPVVVKPRFSVRGRGSSLVTDPAKLEETVRRVQPTFGMPMLQEWIPGGLDQRVSVAVTLDRAGRAITVHARRHVRTVLRSFVSLPCAQASCTEMPVVGDAIRLLQALGYVGHARVQVKIDPRDGVAKLMEINCRPGYRIWCEISVGQPVPLLCVQIHRGVAVDALPPHEGRDVFLNPIEDTVSLGARLLDSARRRVGLGPAQEPSSSPRALLREYREPYRSPRRHFDWYFRALADDPLAALSWYASHLFGARRTHRLETLARIFQRDS